MPKCAASTPIAKHHCWWNIAKHNAHGATIRYTDLPTDLQVLIWQLTVDFDPTINIPDDLPLGTIAVRNLPTILLDEDDRGSTYALAMDLTDTPPILVADNFFLDGKHRAFAARAKNVTHLAAIDLSGIVPAKARDANHMGPALGFIRRTAGV